MQSGNNRQGAIYAGINVDKTLIQMYMLSGALLAFSGGNPCNCR